MRAPLARFGLVAAAATLTFTLASCAGITEPDTDVELPTSSTADDATQPTQGAADSSQANADEFETLELEGALVDSFPTDVPLYEGTVTASVAAVSEVTELPEWNATIVTDHSLETVDAAIREAYSSNGWTIGSDMAAFGGYQLITRSDRYTVSVTYNDLTSSDITINYGVSER